MRTEEYYSESEEEVTSCDPTSSESSSEEIKLKEKKVKELKKLPKYERDDIRNIIFEKINDKYSWGRYGDFDVIIMNKNGYINVTKLCSEAKNKKGNPKNFFGWSGNRNSGDTIDAVSSDTGLPREEILIQVRSSSKHLTEIRGTYAHPFLVPVIVMWANPRFTVQVSKIINEFMISRHLKRIHELENEVTSLKDALLQKYELRDKMSTAFLPSDKKNRVCLFY